MSKTRIFYHPNGEFAVEEKIANDLLSETKEKISILQAQKVSSESKRFDELTQLELRLIKFNELLQALKLQDIKAKGLFQKIFPPPPEKDPLREKLDLLQPSNELLRQVIVGGELTCLYEKLLSLGAEVLDYLDAKLPEVEASKDKPLIDDEKSINQTLNAKQVKLLFDKSEIIANFFRTLGVLDVKLNEEEFAHRIATSLRAESAQQRYAISQGIAAHVLDITIKIYSELLLFSEVYLEKARPESLEAKEHKPRESHLKKMIKGTFDNPWNAFKKVGGATAVITAAPHAVLWGFHQALNMTVGFADELQAANDEFKLMLANAIRYGLAAGTIAAMVVMCRNSRSASQEETSSHQQKTHQVAALRR